MRFKDYLTEDQYKTETDAQGAWELLNKHCKDALKDLERPIVRGMKGFDGGFGVLHGEVGGRKSRNTTNYYTVILDAVLPKEFPKRSGSIICANWQNRSHAAAYGGRLFAIIPFDGVKIGVCPDSDMWDTRIEVNGYNESIEDWNYNLRNSVANDKLSFEEMMERLEKLRAKESGISDWLADLDPGTIKQEFIKAYTKPFKLATTDESKVYNDKKRREVWIGGKCVAINMNVYKDMMKNPDPNMLGQSRWYSPE